MGLKLSQDMDMVVMVDMVMEGLMEVTEDMVDMGMERERLKLMLRQDMDMVDMDMEDPMVVMDMERERLKLMLSQDMDMVVMVMEDLMEDMVDTDAMEVMVMEREMLSQVMAMVVMDMEDL